jgi:predicted lipase
MKETENEEIDFKNNKVIDFNFNIPESIHRVNENKLIKIDFSLQYILDYLHNKKILVYKGNIQEDIGNKYGIDLTNCEDNEYYYIDETLYRKGLEYLKNWKLTEIKNRMSVIELFKMLIVEDIKLQNITK